jgi:hypothetical protein
MAGSNLKPIVHKNFKNEIDKEFVDVEDIGMPYLSLTTNLSPFKKEGSLVQSGGLSYATLNGTDLSIANLPNPGTSFRLVDFYKFSVDRDEKECTILVFEHSSTGEIKLYINPYFNPATDYSNNNPNKTANSWINEWLELTESYINTTNNAYTKASAFTFTTFANLSTTNDYFNGYFVVNLNLDDTDSTKYNFISDYAYSAGTHLFTTKMSMATWTTGHIIRIYKFPVLYFYNADIPDSPSERVGYSNVGTTFKGKPTQFIYHQNQLRMPCGKDLRPLVLDMIYKRTYFAENIPIKYDGFWLDFQQPIQVLYKSYVVATNTYTGANQNIVNHTALNSFLGTRVDQIDINPATTIDNYYSFITTVTLDNRNEIIVGMGIMYKGATGGNSQQLSFNSWFSRKITRIGLYAKVLESDEGIAIGEISIYPYFQWDKHIEVNRLPQSLNASTDTLIKDINGETNNFQYAVNSTNGSYAYTLDTTSGFWYTRIGYFAPTGTQGMTFISSCNRYIDEDTTMNYTRGTFVGETNGRLFISGCKNSVEIEVFETDDNVMYNTLRAGVSAYDTFSKSNLLNVFVGDKDILVDLKTFEGRILAIKKLNCFVIDVNTEDELRFRVTKTQVGRGANYADSICVTPHGIVLPVEDSVYLINSRGAKVILRADNGRLNFYKALYPNGIINCAYYGMYDELYLANLNSDNTQVNTMMVYSFKYDAWTTYNYNTIVTDTGLAIKKIRENSSKGVEFASVLSNTAYNILKIDESVTSYKNVNGGTEYCQWVLSTPYLPYGDKILDMLIYAFTLHYDIFSASNKSLKLTISRNGRSDEVKYLGTGTTADNKVFNELLSLNGEADQLKIRLENVNSSGAVQNITTFNINSFIIWATFQPRQLIQTLNS